MPLKNNIPFDCVFPLPLHVSSTSSSSFPHHAPSAPVSPRASCCFRLLQEVFSFLCGDSTLQGGDGEPAATTTVTDLLNGLTRSAAVWTMLQRTSQFHCLLPGWISGDGSIDQSDQSAAKALEARTVNDVHDRSSPLGAFRHRLLDGTVDEERVTYADFQAAAKWACLVSRVAVVFTLLCRVCAEGRDGGGGQRGQQGQQMGIQEGGMGGGNQDGDRDGAGGAPGAPVIARKDLLTALRNNATAREALQVCKELRPLCSPRGFARVFSMMDEDGDGSLTLHELVCFVSNAVDDAKLQGMFDIIDADQSGAIEKKEVMAAVRRPAHSTCPIDLPNRPPLCLHGCILRSAFDDIVCLVTHPPSLPPSLPPSRRHPPFSYRSGTDLLPDNCSVSPQTYTPSYDHAP